MTKRLKPTDAIKAHCKSCVCGEGKANSVEIENCSLTSCPLYQFRIGLRTRGALTAMRAECLTCTGASSQLVASCPTEDCSLWPYRFGTNPALVGKRGPGRQFDKEGGQ